MKNKKSIFALVLVGAIVASFSLGAMAANTLAEVKAYLDYGATVKLNGVQQSFLDESGNRVYLINYDGTNYLPVRAVANLFGLDVDWDQATRTVLLGASQKTVDLIDDVGAYFLTNQKEINPAFVAKQVQSAEGKTHKISGLECSNYVLLRISKYATAATKVGTACRAAFNLEGKYDSVTFKYYCDNDVTLRVYADGAVQYEVEVPGGQAAQEHTVKLFGARELAFEAVKSKEGSKALDLYIFDASLEPVQK